MLNLEVGKVHQSLLMQRGELREYLLMDLFGLFAPHKYLLVLLTFARVEISQAHSNEHIKILTESKIVEIHLLVISLETPNQAIDQKIHF